MVGGDIFCWAFSILHYFARSVVLPIVFAHGEGGWILSERGSLLRDRIGGWGALGEADQELITPREEEFSL